MLSASCIKITLFASSSFIDHTVYKPSQLVVHFSKVSLVCCYSETPSFTPLPHLLIHVM